MGRQYEQLGRISSQYIPIRGTGIQHCFVYSGGLLVGTGQHLPKRNIGVSLPRNKSNGTIP